MGVVARGRVVAGRWRAEARRTGGWAGLLYVLPALALLLIFELWPILFSIWISLWLWDVQPRRFIGLENYRRLLAEGFVVVDYSDRAAVGEVLQSLLVTTYFVLGTVPVGLALAYDADGAGLAALLQLRDVAGAVARITVLGLTFATMFAFNMAFVRHLRRVYASPRRNGWRRGRRPVSTGS